MRRMIFSDEGSGSSQSLSTWGHQVSTVNIGFGVRVSIMCTCSKFVGVSSVMC